jgi:hypothetical protein
MDKNNNLNDTNSSSSSTPTSSAKRFRSDMASIRAKQTAPMNNNMNNKRAQIPYRNNNQYQRQFHQNHEQQQQTLSPSPTRENLEENLKQMINESKQTADIDLNLNCMDDQLSEVQLAHCPVKVNRIQLI